MPALSRRLPRLTPSSRAVRRARRYLAATHVAAALFWSHLVLLTAAAWLVATGIRWGMALLTLIVSGCAVVLMAAGELLPPAARGFGARRRRWR